MSNWISDENGRWHPAKETAGLINISDKPIVVEISDDSGKKFTKTVAPGAPYTYEGPDRAAMFQWWEENGKPTFEQIKAMPEGSITMGDDFKSNTEFMEQYAKFRNMFGFKDVEEYLKYLGFDKDKAHKRFQEKASVVAKHDLPNRIPEIKKLGGGKDYSSGHQHIYGGFSDDPGIPAQKGK